MHLGGTFAVRVEYIGSTVVVKFDWDRENQAHAIRHRLTPTIVASVSEIDPQFFLDDEAKSGSHIMIGPDRAGALWTVILLDLEEDL